MKILGCGEGENFIISASLSEIEKLTNLNYYTIRNLKAGVELNIKTALETARILKLNGNQVQDCADKLQKFVDELRKYDPKKMILESFED